MKEQIKELRVKLDGLAQLTKEIVPQAYVVGHGSDKVVGFESKELTRCYDSLILAKAWLGKILGELGAENPYKSGYKTVEDIEPAADKHTEINQTQIFGKEQGLINENYLNYNHIEKVDWLRQEIQSIIDLVIPINIYNQTREAAVARTNVYNHLCEAKFWLGFELQRIKENGL
jgi:hypothetical protein